MAEARPDALAILRRLRTLTDSVIVAFSRGKDALVCLDLAKSLFRRVEAFHMHLIPGLTFAEEYLTYAERRWGITIDRVPHWGTSLLLQGGAFRTLARGSCPKVTYEDIRNGQRNRTGLRWIVSGEKRSDSLFRAKQMAQCGGLDIRTGDAFPVATWTDRQVYLYLRKRNIPLPADYRLAGRSISSALDGADLAAMATYFPEDYARVLEVFPFAEAAVKRWQLGRDPSQRRRVRFRGHRTGLARPGWSRPGLASSADVHDGAGGAGVDQSGTVQSANDHDGSPERPEEIASARRPG